MAQTLRSALAVPFTWTSAGAGSDFSIAFPSGASPVTGTVATGTYSMVLAPSASDFLRVVAAALNAAMVGAGRAETFAVTMGTDSRVTVALSAGTFSTTWALAFKWLGYTGNAAGVASSKAPAPPLHFATFISRVSNGWSPMTAVAGAETLDGRGYGVTAAVNREEDDVRFDFIPLDPTTRTAMSLDQTPWEPAIGSTFGSHLGQWSIRDVLATAPAKTCTAALGNFQTIIASTTERYSYVTLPFSEAGKPRRERQREGWDAYVVWTVRLLRQQTQTGTRA